MELERIGVRCTLNLRHLKFIGEGGRHPFWHGSSAGTPSQWRYASKKSCSVVRRQRVTASVLTRYLGIGPAVAKVSHGFPRFLFLGGHGSILVNVCGNPALCASEDQGDSSPCLTSWLAPYFRGSQHELVRTIRPQSNHTR
ncbi:hypothetical protein TNCV_1076041 [Trichonephila clavipes]|nr:hypothetical protein TNCV_1076041 [Trichonephila clavipes]